MNDLKLVKFRNNDVVLNVNVSPEEDTVWLNVEEISYLFSRERSVVSKHIKNIFKEKELDENSSVHFLHIAGSTKPVKFFNLDVIISVGYRVKSKNGVVFRKWANSILKQYLIKGYVLSNRALITKDNYISLVNKVAELDQEVNKFKKEIKLIKPSSAIFYSGQYYDSFSFMTKLLKEVNNKLIIIDPYIDDSYHDRFIIFDDNIVYHIGTSLNYLGKKTFVLNKIHDSNWVDSFIVRANKNERQIGFKN